MTADRATTFKASLGALNAQFAAWVAGQAASAPHALWAGGARDYVKHAAGLVEEYKDVLGGGGAPAEAAPTPAMGLFGTPAPAAPAPFNFGAPPAGGGLFGGPPAASATSAGGGLFGAAPPPAGGGFGGFAGFSGFGGAPPPPAAVEEEAEEAEGEEEAPTPAALDAGAAMAFKAGNARVHAMAAGTKAWVDRGRGVLTVRSPGGGEGAAPSSSSSTRPHVVFTTDTGRVLLNAVLYKGLVTAKARKPHMVTATLANAAALPGSQDGGGGGEGAAAPALAPHLFTLASEEEADAFMGALKAAVAKHCIS